MGSVSSIPFGAAADGGFHAGGPSRRGGDTEPTRPRAQAYFCHDCNRRFYNLGWHAEACGLSNYSKVSA